MPVCKLQDFWIQQSTKEYSFESQYEIGKELGRGATSCVFKCQRRGLPKTWAVKVLVKNVDKRVSKADIGLLLRLDHKNLVRFKEVFESKSRIFIVQELVTGGELFERVVNIGQYSEAVAARAVKDIVAGIRPENLLYENLSEDSPLKIGDFALSSILNTEVNVSSVCGSPAYAAPELLKGERFGTAVDMWAIGVITFILLGGYEAFSADSPADLFKKILKGQYEFASIYWNGIGVNGKDFIRKLLVVDPNKRLTAEGASLNCWVNGIGASTSPLERTANRIKSFNEKQKSKGPGLEVSSTPRSRAASRAGPQREMSPLPGVDPNEVVAALPEVIVCEETEDNAQSLHEEISESYVEGKGESPDMDI
ncbi:calcium/calmodulin-dependent protein kinase type iv-like [Plakobranchus ocellatus]|uniref:Calcium/calmodulin-dependent protein kinase type iv-like n=1 Tax=Plakobranchus ocellatus TaxID=259542 RepID=A0AAV4CQV3_9GAST|nr:calcium/calmodulin-dependent protein kinase type iv-like [Plakobranchus ocellatus]